MQYEIRVLPERPCGVESMHHEHIFERAQIGKPGEASFVLRLQCPGVPCTCDNYQLCCWPHDKHVMPHVGCIMR